MNTRNDRPTDSAPPPWPAAGPPCPHPPPTITTDRLTLRPITRNDLPLYRATFADPRVMATVLKRTESEAELRQRVDRYARSWAERGTLHVFAVAPRRAIHNQHTNTTLQPNQPVGDAMLVPVARQGPEIELGYRFAAHAWGIGLATEAARALIPYAFQTLALTEIIAVTDPDNHASQRVLAKLGFQNRGNTDRYYNQTTTRFTLARPHAPSL